MIFNANDGRGIIPIEEGGTGASTVAGARNKLGLGNTSGAVPIANGGTGATTKAKALSNLGGISITEIDFDAVTSLSNDHIIKIDNLLDYDLALIVYEKGDGASEMSSIIIRLTASKQYRLFFGNDRYRVLECNSAGLISRSSSNTTVCIPKYIYGIKGVL